MGLGDFFEAEGRTGAVANATDKLSNLALKLRDRKVEDQRYQDGERLRKLNTEEAELGVKSLRNQIAAREQESARQNKRIPLDVFQSSFEFPEQFEHAKKIAASQGAINIEDPEAPYLTVGDAERMRDILGDEGNSLKFAQIGYDAAKKQKVQLIQALQQMKPDSKEYQAAQEQLVAVTNKIQDYGAMKDSILKLTSAKDTNEEKNVAALTAAFGGGADARAKAIDKVFNRRGKSDEEFLRGIYTEVAASFDDEKALEITKKAAKDFGIDFNAVFGADSQQPGTETPSILSAERGFGFDRAPEDIKDNVSEPVSNPLGFSKEELDSFNVDTPAKAVVPIKSLSKVANKGKGNNKIRALVAGIKRAKKAGDTKQAKALAKALLIEKNKNK